MLWRREATDVLLVLRWSHERAQTNSLISQSVRLSATKTTDTFILFGDEMLNPEDTYWLMRPNREKALMLAQRAVSVFVYDAVRIMKE